MKTLKWFRDPKYPEAVIPGYAHDGDSGFDFVAAEDAMIFPGGRVLVSTGLKCEIPFGYEIQVRPRSGMALKHGITVLNTPGTIDSGYRGLIGVILINHSDAPYVINVGDRIAQGIFARVEYCQMSIVYNLDDSDRGPKGFGSSGR